MPELPDVEAVIGRIRNGVTGRRIISVSILDNRLSGAGLDTLPGRRINRLDRRGKYILFSLQGGDTLLVHLRMTGNLLLCDPTESLHKHTRLMIVLDNDGELRFIDQRRLGVARVIRDMNFREFPGLLEMGPEPLSPDFTLQRFKALLKGKRGMIKALLLDQRFIAGIGNIYGDEILFQSGIRPTRKACELSEAEIQRLHGKIRQVLERACKHYADLRKMEDWFIHGRSDGYCMNCGGKLDRVKIQGRYSWFCPGCQK